MTSEMTVLINVGLVLVGLVILGLTLKLYTEMFPGDDPESVPILTIHGWQFLLAGGSRVAAEPGGSQ